MQKIRSLYIYGHQNIIPSLQHVSIIYLKSGGGGRFCVLRVQQGMLSSVISVILGVQISNQFKIHFALI